MNKQQRAALAGIRKQLRSKAWDGVAAGIDEAAALDDREIDAVLVDGLHIDASAALQVPEKSELHRRVRAAHRDAAALLLARQAGLLDAVPRLRIRGVALPVALQAVAGLPQLESLSLTELPDDADLSVLRGLPSLRELLLQGEVVDLSILKEIPSLTVLTLSGVRLAELSFLVDLPGLKGLTLHRTRALGDISGLRAVPGLTQLSLVQCEAVSDFSALGALPEVAALELTWSRLWDLSVLSGMSKLRSLDLDYSAVTDLSAVGQHPLLEELRFSSFAGDPAPLAALRRLKKLSLSMSQTVTSLDFLAGMEALRGLDVYTCRRLRDLSALPTLTGLTRLSIYGQEQTDLSVMAGLEKLELLWLLEWRELTDLSALAGMTRLKHLTVAMCDSLADLTPLAALTGLESLFISRSAQDIDLSPLVRLPALKSLTLMGCEATCDITPLLQVPALAKLDLSGCTGVRDVSVLAGAPALGQVTLRRHPDVEGIEALRDAGVTVSR